MEGLLWRKLMRNGEVGGENKEGKYGQLLHYFKFRELSECSIAGRYSFQYVYILRVSTSASQAGHVNDWF